MSKKIKENIVEIEKDFNNVTSIDAQNELIMNYILDSRERYFVYGFVFGVIIATLMYMLSL